MNLPSGREIRAAYPRGRAGCGADEHVIEDGTHGWADDLNATQPRGGCYYRAIVSIDDAV